MSLRPTSPSRTGDGDDLGSGGGAGAADLPPTSLGRRAISAHATREAILLAARRLFVDRGYFGTRVSDIAASAHVAPATVYAVGGGKSGLLRTLIETGVSDPDMFSLLDTIDTFDSAPELLDYLVATTTEIFGEWSDLMRAVTAAAAFEAEVLSSLRTAESGHRAGMERAAQRIAELGALAPGTTVAESVDVLVFYLGNRSYYTLVDDLGWPLDRARHWLSRSVRAAVLRDGGTASGDLTPGSADLRDS